MDTRLIIIAVALLGGMGALFGIILAIAGKIFAVEQDERIGLVRECLPGANCGGCGFAGCDAMAEAIVSGAAPVNGCPVGGAAVAKQVASVLGQEAGETARRVAVVACQGSSDLCAPKYNYYGSKDCVQAANVQGGPKGCAYGCIGFGTCVKACQFGAIFINAKGIAEVDPEKCVSCGACIKACPKSVIRLAAYEKFVEAVCSSQESARTTRAQCKTGCIKCSICVNQCPESAIALDAQTGLPVIDHAKCTNCGTCVAKCPQKVIVAQPARAEEKKSA